MCKSVISNFMSIVKCDFCVQNFVWLRGKTLLKLGPFWEAEMTVGLGWVGLEDLLSIPSTIANLQD